MKGRGIERERKKERDRGRRRERERERERGWKGEDRRRKGGITEIITQEKDTKEGHKIITQKKDTKLLTK